MSGITELAKMLKEREPKQWSGIQTGEVIRGLPHIEIRLNEFVVLDKEDLLFASHLIGGYKRRIKFTDYNVGNTSNASNHSHSIPQINIDTEMEWTDTLQVGDTVIIIPTANEQLYYVIDKVVTV